MRILVAILVALAIVAAQLAYGGLMRTTFAMPAYFFVAVAGILSAVVVFWKRGPAPQLAPALAVGGAVAWLVWRSLVATTPDHALFYTVLACGCGTIFYVVAGVVNSPGPRFAWLGVMATVALAQTTVAAFQFLSPDFYWPLPWFSEQMRIWYAKPGVFRGHGVYLNANHLAWFLNGTGLICLAVGCLGRCSAWVRVLFIYLAAVCVGGTILTLSRGGLLGLAGGLIVFAILVVMAFGMGAKGRRGVFALVAICALLAALGGGYTIFTQSISAQARAGFLTEDSYRSQIWPAAVRQAQMEPLVGTGAGSFTQLSRRLRDYAVGGDDTFAHNDWIQLAADYGFVGLVAVSLAFLVVVWRGLAGFGAALRERMAVSSSPSSNSAAFSLGSIAVLTAFGIHSFFDFNMHIPANALLACACAGFLANPGVAAGMSRSSGRVARWLVCLASLAMGGVTLYLVQRNAKVEYQSLLAENRLLLMDSAGAARIAREGLADHPRHARLHRILGEALLGTPGPDGAKYKETREARESLQIAAESDPEERWNRLLLAIAEENMGNLREAEKAHIESIRLDPGAPVFHEYYGLFLESNLRKSDAIRAYRAALLLPGTTFARQRFDALNKP